MKWIKNKPFSFYIFGFTAAVFLLQVLPYPGIFLMLIMAPFWSILTLNAGFASLAFEAYFGIVSRKWMLAPIAWFGGYIAVALLNHLTFYQLSNEMAQFNSGKSLPFSNTTTALVLDRNAAHFNDAPQMFVQLYDLATVYETAKNGSHSAYRAATTIKLCERQRSNSEFTRLGLTALDYAIGRRYFPGICAVKYTEDPKLPTVTATATTKTYEGWWLPYTVDSVRVEAASGEAIELRSGYAAPLSLFPQPILGCFLISHPASWKCTFHFWEGRMQGLGAHGPYGEASVHVIAKALNLKRFEASTTRVQSDLELEKTIADRMSRAISNLDELISNPSKKVTSSELAGLSTRPDILGPRAEGMVVALFQAIDANLSLWENSLNLQRLIALLKPEDFNRIGNKLLAEFRARPNLNNNVFTVELVRRLAELGPGASEILAKVALSDKVSQSIQFSDKNSQAAAALLGLCALGKSAAEYAEGIAEILNSTTRSEERHAASYVALLRMGREDLADKDPDAKSSSRAEAYKLLRKLSASERTAKFCVRSNNWIYLINAGSPTP